MTRFQLPSGGPLSESAADRAHDAQMDRLIAAFHAERHRKAPEINAQASSPIPEGEDNPALPDTPAPTGVSPEPEQRRTP